jgi:hypothetical protein
MDGDFDDWPGVVVSDTCPARPRSDARYQVWQCVNIVPEEIEKWLAQLRRDAPALLEIDELHTLVYKRDCYSPEFNRILKTGRSAPIGTIALTQELSKIPANAYKQAIHRLGFYIDKASRYDRQIWQALLKDQLDDPADEFGLYYQHQNGRSAPRYYENIQQFLGIA